VREIIMPVIVTSVPESTAGIPACYACKRIRDELVETFLTAISRRNPS
jgi:hypothetical protein